MKLALIVGVVIALAATSGATAASLITGRQVKDGTLTGRDLKNGSVKRADLAKSVRGLNGPTGAQGAVGPKGAAAPPLHPVEATGSSLIRSGETFSAEAQCPDESPFAIGGGYRFTTVSGAVVDSSPVVLRSEPFLDHREWNVVARNDGPATVVLTVTASCITAG